MQQSIDSNSTMRLNQVSLFHSLNQGSPFKQHALKCVADNKAVDMCLNQKCSQKNVFQCASQNCQCKEIHYRCSQGKSKCVIKMINSKFVSTQSFVQVINHLIDKKIDELSDLRQTLIKIVERDLKCIDLSVLEKKFLGMMNGEIKVEEFTSIESKTIWQLSNALMPTKESNIFTRLNHILNYFGESITSNIEELKTNINDFIQQKKEQYERKALELEITNSVKRLQPEVMEKSSICRTEQLSQRFIRIFGKKIRKLSHLFCASQNEFSLKKYFEVCGKVENTVVVCRTNMDKIIGGFTPLVHDNQVEAGYTKDPSGESFIFSLTDQEKFTLKEKNGAIYSVSKRDQICFGDYELAIHSNNCRTRVNNKFYYSSAYPAYSNNDKTTCLKFNGNQSECFKPKQWQVWKVEF